MREIKSRIEERHKFMAQAKEIEKKKCKKKKYTRKCCQRKCNE